MLIRHLLLPYEAPLYMAHLKRLCDEDRFMRFQGIASDLFIEEYVETISWPMQALFGAFDTNMVFRGAAHVSVSRQVADLGLSVEKDFRGQGVGTRLLDRTLAWARSKVVQVERFSSQCLSRNSWMIAKVKERGFEVEMDGSVSVATMTDLDPLSPIESTTIALQEQFAWAMWNQGVITRPFAVIDALKKAKLSSSE